MNTAVKMNSEEFGKLRALIYERAGIYFPDNRVYLLESRLVNRLAENHCKTYMEYYNFLKYNNKNTKENSLLFDAVTTNETSFFRDRRQLKAFEEVVLPSIVSQAKKNGHHPGFKVWSAACSTGEEAYSIAMIASLKGDLLRGSKLEIIASDISEKVLATARRGVYSSYVLRNTPQEYIAKFFTQKAEQSYGINPDIKSQVKFMCLNLIDRFHVRMIRNVDVVFCRNVLIYFDDDAKKRVISSIYDALVPNGYLVLGHSESLHNISRAFKLINHNRSIVYQKM